MKDESPDSDVFLRIERLLDGLTTDEQLQLIETLARRVRGAVRRIDPRDIEVAAMGSDPGILRECAALRDDGFAHQP